MAHISCPKCRKRLRTPDTDETIVIRCPSCKHTFTTASESSETTQPSASPANASQAEAEFDVDEDVTQRFSMADEAMLRGLDAGTGLLELTREAYDAGLDSRGATGVGPTPLPTPEDAPRQFSVVATALSLANRLAQTHKIEAARYRQNARLAWIVVAVLAVFSGFSLWYGTWRAGAAALEKADAKHEVELQRASATSAEETNQATIKNLTARVTDLTSQLAEERSRASKATSDLDKARSDLAAAQSQLAAARETAGESKATIQTLTADLQAAKNRIQELTAPSRAGAQPSDGTRSDGSTRATP